MGGGGTKISAVNPYTVLETSIYRSLAKSFIKEALRGNATKVSSVAPFAVCFSTKRRQSNKTSPPNYRPHAANNDIACLAFMDGGFNPEASIVLGGYQLEDNFVQFDLESSMFGFTSSLLLKQTSCAYFNFTSNMNLNNYCLVSPM
ncbi:LOW QUALITY PROTEIN: Xylanase inhibitor, C-terminal, partial [Dillenia turbinata]